MRMWMVPVIGMCDKHLLGEHVEHHMLVGSINKGKSINGFIRNNLIEPSSIHKRHGEIAKEMIARGMNHKSPLPYIETGNLTDYEISASVNVINSFQDLIFRCKNCRKRMLDKLPTNHYLRSYPVRHP